MAELSTKEKLATARKANRLLKQAKRVLLGTSIIVGDIF
jgi:hypothetical protein